MIALRFRAEAFSRRALVAATLVCAGLATGAPAAAQRLGLPGQDRDKPIEIHADNGIEWQQTAQAYIARGNARAAQGNAVVHADTLVAYYRKGAQGGTEIWRIDADGHVRIAAPGQEAFGDKAVYDVENGVLVLTGNVRLVTATERISARDSLEYWDKRNLAVARGDAVAIRGNNRLRADVMTAHFERGETEKAALKRIDAFDNVVITSPAEIVHGNRGVYNVETAIAVISGNVRITRGDSQLNGGRAEVNLNTGVSRLVAGGGERVRGYFVPNDSKIEPGAGGGGALPHPRAKTGS